MNELFKEFANAQNSRNGYELAQTLTPVAPPNRPHKLSQVWQSTNIQSVNGDVRRFIKGSTSHKSGLSQDEINGWTDVYVSYWKALGEILAGEKGKVRLVL